MGLFISRYLGAVIHRKPLKHKGLYRGQVIIRHKIYSGELPQVAARHLTQILIFDLTLLVMSNRALLSIDGSAGGRIFRRMPLGPNSERIQAIVTKDEKLEFLKICKRRRQSESSLAAMIISDWIKGNK